MNKVSEKILADARKEAAEIEAEARREEGILIKDRDKALALATAKQEERLAAIYRAELRRQKALSEIEFRKSTLLHKRALMEEVFQDVSTYIEAPEIYQRFLEAMILQGVESGEEVIIVSEKDRDLLDDEFLTRVNEKATKQLGRPTNLRLASEARETGGGLYLKQGKIEFNATMDAVMQRIAEDVETELAAFLFSENG